MQFYCKDPEFVQIICFEIALQESYWPLASDLTCEWKGRDAHRKIDPLKRMCKTWLLNKSYTNCAKTDVWTSDTDLMQHSITVM